MLLFDFEIVWRRELLKHIALIKCSTWESQMSQNIWNTRNIHHCLKGLSKALIAWSNDYANKIVSEWNEDLVAWKKKKKWNSVGSKSSGLLWNQFLLSSSASYGRTKTGVGKSHIDAISLTLAINSFESKYMFGI